MNSKRTPDQAWGDAMAAWQLPDAEAERLARAEQTHKREMATLRSCREAMRRMRKRAAEHARMARRHEANANKAKEQHFQLMYRSEAVNHYAQYRAYRNSAGTLALALTDAEMQERKATAVETLRAMG